MGNNGIGSTSWTELSGKNNWEGLLEPLHIDLRKYILLYGDFAGSIGTACNDEKASKWYGFSRYTKKDLFHQVGLNKEIVPMYEVTKFIYATSDLEDARKEYIPKSSVPNAEDSLSTFVGFVAISTDIGTAKLGRKDILIVWRGTLTHTEADLDFKFFQTSATKILGEAHNPKVHKGWYSLYTTSVPGFTYNNNCARDQVHEEITRLMDSHPKESELSITLVGHSMGSALATLNAVDLANGYHGLTPLPRNNCLISFLLACPRLGDGGFKNLFDTLENLHALRISNRYDPVPNLPPKINLLIPPTFYSDVGQELVIDTHLSPYLKPDFMKLDHQLEVYLHGVAGTQGSKGGFELEVDRDLALTNRSLDALKDEYLVPVSWWVQENKGMVQQEDSTWKLVNDHGDD